MREVNTNVDQDEAVESRRGLGPLQPLGPDSLMWKDFGAYHYQLMLPQAFVLQTAHPVIDAAVGKEKKYKHNPWGRAKDSIALLWPVVYSRPDKAIAMGHRLRELHREIKGVDANGKRYHALDPEAYSWVHITGFDVIVRLHEYFAEPLSAAQRAQAFQEWKQVGSLLGILEQHIPQSEAEYWDYFNKIIDERLEIGEVVRDLLSLSHYINYPKPPKSNLKDWQWRLLAYPIAWFHRCLTIETLPTRFKEKFSLKNNILDRLAFRCFSWGMRKFYPRLPEQKRYISLAYAAIEDARLHPEAYRYSPGEGEQHSAGVTVSETLEPASGKAAVKNTESELA